ncbi:glycosyltransferase family 2 protein [bacterium]|nr:glycosyltransferase family 2 protein [bacterium]
MSETMRERARCTVVVLSYNARAYLEPCLESLEADRQAGRARVVVVDNGSRDGSAALVRGRFPGVELLELPRNVGFSAGNNAALARCESEYALLLNPDTEARAGAIQRLVAFMDETPRCAVVGPRLVNPDGSRQLSCRSFPGYKTAFFNRYSLLTRWFPENRHSRDYLMSSLEATEPMEVDWVSGAAMMVRRGHGRSGSLDERFFMYAEDVDWCYRFKAAGWEVWYEPRAEILHHIGGSSASLPVRSLLERHRSRYYFNRKHYSRGVPILDLMVAVGVLVRLLVHLPGARRGRSAP